MLSKENARILEWVKQNDRCFFSDEPRPDWITEVRLDDLVQKKLLNLLSHPSGVMVYILTPSGEDAITNRRWSRFLAIASLVISVLSLLASFTAVVISAAQLL